MPFETRLFIKTSVTYLVLTFLVGAALLIAKALGHPAPFIIGVEHGHLAFVGWLVNIVMGVALWLFPLDRERFPETSGRYPVRAVLAAYFLLNIGLPLRAIVEPWHDLGGGSPLSAILLAMSGIMQLAAIVVFASVIWQRIRPPSRPAPGVR